MTEEAVPYGTPLSFADTPTHIAACFRRLHTAAGCHTQAELARVLGVPVRTLADSARRSILPANWLLTLLCKHWINPAWILTGLGPLYINPDEYAQHKCDTQSHTPHNCNTSANAPLHRSLSTESLLAELVRRAIRELA